MFANDVQIMLYVDDVAAAADFWESLGFVILERQEADGTMMVEIGASAEAEAHFVLYDRQFVINNAPEVNIAPPSVMFYATDVEGLYRKLLALDVTLGDLMMLGERMIFNFADNDGNYFAVSSK